MFKRILVPLDGSELAEEALATAHKMAHQYDADVFLLRVYEPEQALAAPVSSFDTYHLVVSVKEVRERAIAYLEKIKTAHDDVVITPLVIESVGGVGKVIATQAAEHEIDLIVMTSHGYTGFRRFVMGSVTTETLKQAECPVLVIPAKSI